MQAYRTQPADPQQIVLVLSGVTFSRRLRATLRANRSWVAVFAAMGLLLPTFVALQFWGSDDMLPIFGWGALVNVTLFTVPVLLAAVIGSATPNPNEVLLPRRISLREGAIEVTPRDGPSFEARWTWIAEARETKASFLLILSRDPRAEMEVSKSILVGEQGALLGRWLREHKILRA